jgi:hypothetical protein
VRDPRHRRHAQAMAVCHQNEADDQRAMADRYRALDHTGAATAEAWCRQKALECGVRGAFALDAITAEEQAVALELSDGTWHGDVESLLAVARVVLGDLGQGVRGPWQLGPAPVPSRPVPPLDHVADGEAPAGRGSSHHDDGESLRGDRR